MPSDSLEKIARDLFVYLADRFPVCCSSDEFVFFPQALADRKDWSCWDDFSPESVLDAVGTLRSCRHRLVKIMTSDTGPDSGERRTLSLLYKVAETLEEQLDQVRHHAIQPTFVLMVATVGLIQALQDHGRDALIVRMGTLPGFLERCRMNFESVPDLFRQAGVRMAGDFSRWLLTLTKICDPTTVLAATEDLLKDLKSSSSARDFRLHRDVLERVVNYHMGSGMDSRSCIRELEDEVGLTTGALQSESVRLGYGKNWESAYNLIAGEPFAEGEKPLLLGKEINRLRLHCARTGFPVPEETDLQPIDIQMLPESLAPVRSADSYNAKPGHPYRGGVFYIFGNGGLGHATGLLHPVYRMTAAHETYPGHHLLDLCRWNNSDPLRRPIEYPLFYEGWSCFGEELMLDSGAFDREYDGLILARRRHRHAIRGMVDLFLHRGDLDLDAAAQQLVKAGFSQKRAGETVRKYALRPAYQMCYTLGYRKFRALFRSHGRRGMGSFATKVLGQGEILFEDLERVLEKENV